MGICLLRVSLVPGLFLMIVLHCVLNYVGQRSFYLFAWRSQDLRSALPLVNITTLAGISRASISLSWYGFGVARRTHWHLIEV